MPKRRSVKRHGTDEVQGEGSYVILTSVKVREIRALRKVIGDNPEDVEKLDEKEIDKFEEGLSLVTRHIKEWNWVNDDDEPMLIPNDDSSTVDELTNEETEFLTGLLMGTDKESKNSESAS